MRHFISTVFLKATFQIMVIGLKTKRWWKYGVLGWSPGRALLKKRLLKTKKVAKKTIRLRSRCSFVPISFLDPLKPPKCSHTIYGYQQVTCHQALTKYITVLERGPFECWNPKRQTPAKSTLTCAHSSVTPLFYPTVGVWRWISAYSQRASKELYMSAFLCS